MIALGCMVAFALLGFFAVAVIIGNLITADFTRLRGQEIVDYRYRITRIGESE